MPTKEQTGVVTGVTLKRDRIALGLSAEEVAAEAGVTLRHLRELETDGGGADLTVLSRVKAWLDRRGPAYAARGRQ